MNTFEKVKKVSREKKMTLQELERKAGLSAGCINHWKTVCPSAMRLKRVAVLLGVTMEELIGDD